MPNKSLDVSIILAIYNAERTLKECLDSIFKQKFPEKNYEVIVVDGGSKDKTLDIIRAYQTSHSNIRLYHNAHKLSEGKGMGKDQGVKKSRGKFLLFLDHDNILEQDNWLSDMLEPFQDKKIMASQSLLRSQKRDTNFLNYINEIGVEDPFAVPYSIVAQISLAPQKFKLIKNKYYIFSLSKSNILFFGANGCIFRKSVFKSINGYTRDVDVSANMAHQNMSVAVPKYPRIYHKTSNDMLSFLKKKAIYFNRFISKEYETKSFKWTQIGQPPSNLRFFLMILTNLTIIIPLCDVLPRAIIDKRLFWFLHPFYVFFMTLLYGLITLTKFRNFLKYI